MLVSGAALMLACAAFFAYDLYSFRIGTTHNLSTQADIIGSNTVSALVFNDARSAENTLLALKGSPNIVYAAVYSADGQPFASYWRDHHEPALPLPTLPARGQDEVHWFDGEHIAVLHSIVFQQRLTGFVYIRSDRRSIRERLRSYALISVLVLLLCLVFALLVSRISQRVISQPVVGLAETARAVSQQKNYSIRAAPTGSEDEVSTLIDAFNEMLAQIEQRDAALEQGRDELEARVNERTIQLAVANKELELKNREVERATKLKSQFLANMSHELRTPLNAIIGFSDLLAEGMAGTLNTKQQRFVNHIKQGSNHLLQLINDILDLSKIEAGQLEIRCEHFSVAEAIPEVLSNIRPLAMAKNIEIHQKIQTDRTVFADRIRFKQILYNLLSNAAKFTPKDGKIEVACAEEGEMVSISVTDTGIGIRPEDQSLIFEEFRQVAGSGKKAEEGTGLGLAITKRLVERQRGQIFVESAQGKGSRFTFTLPAGAQTAAPEIVPPTPQPHPAPATGKPLILVVDDELSAKELLASYLSSDYRIALASSGAEALEKAKELRPDAITLDVLMAGGNGFETLARLRQTPELANTPVIIVSIVDQQRVGFALGATDYLIKPIRKNLLLETIRKHVPTNPDEDDAILLVDDDIASLQLMEETLRLAGYETQSVQCGMRALEVLSSKMVSAVLLDLLMPGMDGFEVIRHVRKEPTLKDLPIFVITGKNLTREESDLLARDTQALFHKTDSCREQLISEVGRVLQVRKMAAASGRR